MYEEVAVKFCLYDASPGGQQVWLPGAPAGFDQNRNQQAVDIRFSVLSLIAPVHGGSRRVAGRLRRSGKAKREEEKDVLVLGAPAVYGPKLPQVTSCIAATEACTPRRETSELPAAVSALVSDCPERTILAALRQSRLLPVQKAVQSPADCFHQHFTCMFLVSSFRHMTPSSGDSNWKLEHAISQWHCKS